MNFFSRGKYDAWWASNRKLPLEVAEVWMASFGQTAFLPSSSAFAGPGHVLTAFLPASNLVADLKGSSVMVWNSS
jgi:hypothetical protein